MIASEHTPYPDRDFSPQEEWAECEAQQLERQISGLRDILQEHLVRLTERAKTNRPNLDYVHLGFDAAQQIAMKIHALASLADGLRRSRIIRLEMHHDQG